MEAAADCFDCNDQSGLKTPIPIKSLKTLQEMLADYNTRPENKFLNGRPFNKGPTRRRHIELSAVHYIGKEANLYDEQTYLGSIPDAQVVYGLGKTQAEAMLKDVCASISKYGALRFARATDISRQHIHDIVKGETKPSGAMLLELHRGIKSVEAANADKIDDEQSTLAKARHMIETGAVTVKGLAEAIKCDGSHLAKVICGKRNISQNMTQNLASFLANNRDCEIEQP